MEPAHAPQVAAFFDAATLRVKVAGYYVLPNRRSHAQGALPVLPRQPNAKQSRRLQGCLPLCVLWVRQPRLMLQSQQALLRLQSPLWLPPPWPPLLQPLPPHLPLPAHACGRKAHACGSTKQKCEQCKAASPH